MGDWANAALQTAFWTYANSLRHEAKLCDIVLYVKGRRGAMVGYPAHKLLLISASKYLKLLFEREDLRNYCHFPHLTEDGLFTVLDIVYGREIPDEIGILDDALMAARFLQVDSAVEALERKRIELARLPSPTHTRDNASPVSGVGKAVKRKAESQQQVQHHHSSNRSVSRSSDSSGRTSPVQQQQQQHYHASQAATSAKMSKARRTDPEHSMAYSGDSHQSQGSFNENDTADTDQDQLPVTIKMEPDVDLTGDDSQSEFPTKSEDYDQDQSYDQQLGQDGTEMGYFSGVRGQGDHQMASSMPYQTTMNFSEADFSSHAEGGAGMQSFAQGDELGLGQSQADWHRMVWEKLRASVSQSEDKKNTENDDKAPVFKLYSCVLCGKECGNEFTYKRHMTFHSKMRSFQCELCERAFKQSSDLKRHMLAHTGAKPFQCGVCGAEYSQSGSLYRHISSSHPGVQPHQCQICGEGFVDSHHLKQHMESHHL